MTVVVNANGVVIQTIFTSDIDYLDYYQIAAAFTEAQQNAMIALARKTAELIAAVPERATVNSPSVLTKVPPVPPRISIDDATPVADAFEEPARSVLHKAW